MDKPVPLFVKQINASRGEVAPKPRYGRREVLFEQVSAVMVGNPGKDNEWVAAKMGVELKVLERIIARPGFVEVLTARRDRMCGEVMKEALIANHGVHLEAVDQAKERIPEMGDGDLVKLVEVTGRNLGLHRDNKANVAVQNNFVVKWLTDDVVDTQ